jgi:hypothetical protein
MYQIACVWPDKLFLFCGVASFLFSFVVANHLYSGFKDGILFGRLVEFAVTFCVFCVPIATNPFFHFHHWFAAWLVGMHINQHYWWSWTVMALFFGVYINGIAGYGRDSLLGCKSAFYNSQQQQCGHLLGDVDLSAEFCFYLDLPTHNGNVSLAPEYQSTNASAPSYVPPSNQYLGFGEAVPLDWRNCSAAGGH